MKIAFLFLTISGLYHEQPWINYFKDHQGQYSIYVHPKKKVPKDSFLAPHVIEERKPTTWANTMNAQVALLRQALQDMDNYKFVFVSESTIPLTTFEYMYDFLTEDNKSIFFYRKNPFGQRTFNNTKKLHNNPQWIILNREHAELMVNDKTVLPIMSKYPHDQEHYPSTLLAHHGVLSEVHNKDCTMCIWQGQPHPHAFHDLATDPHTDLLINLIKQQRVLFGRKFTKECDLSLLKPYLPTLFS